MGLVTEEQVERVLQLVRPIILADGGDLELVKVDYPYVFVKLQGACVGCPLSFYTVQHGIKKALCDEFATELEVVLID